MAPTDRDSEMSKKSELYQTLKEMGASFDRPYVEYTVKELEELAVSLLPVGLEDKVEEDPEYQEALAELERLSAPAPAPETPAEPPQPAPLAATGQPPITRVTPAPARPQVAPRAHAGGSLSTLAEMVAQVARAGLLKEGATFAFTEEILIPVRAEGAKRAGLTYSVPEGQPIRVDLNGRIWFRDEVRKPAIPQPRMTRKTHHMDNVAVQQETFLPNGRLDEIYEVAGEERREVVTTTTLPSWQVGKYLDPRFPFMVHVYGDAMGFDYMEVIRYFGGRDLVPSTIKTLYVGNQNCFSIPTVRETIEQQYNILKRSN